MLLALMVIPRSRSRSIESSTCALISRWESAPVSSSSRSASVDFPWSMCAIMQKLRMNCGFINQPRPCAPRRRGWARRSRRIVARVLKRFSLPHPPGSSQRRRSDCFATRRARSLAPAGAVQVTKGAGAGITGGEGAAMHWWIPEIPWSEKIFRSLIVYLFLLVVFRLLGKRQVGQLTPFDLIVLLMISNVLQNAMIGPDNSVTGGLLGATTILVTQWLLARFAFLSRRLERAVEGDPVLLVHHGRVIESGLRRENFSREDLLSNLRAQGVFDVGEVKAAVLETSGKLSVLRYEKPNYPARPGKTG